MPIQVTVKAKDIRFNWTLSSTNIISGNEVSIMCHARCNGIPDDSLYDYLGDLSKSFFVVQVPKCPKWYFSIRAVYQSNFQKGKPEDVQVCLSTEWKMIYCQNGKDGPKCVWNEHELQVFLFSFLFLVI